MNREINELVIFLEELSAKVMLEKGLLPKIIPYGVQIRCICFEGKQDLDKNVLGKLRGWQNPKAAFVILHDQDSGDCKEIKQLLLNECRPVNKSPVLIRIACHELESWYPGDLNAVEKGLGLTGLAKYQNNKKFRDPDALSNASQELEKLTHRKYQKVGGSRAIGPYMSIGDNRSHSFAVFIAGIKQLFNLPY